jgi:3-oxoacyl-(acyl-carrier-protein) synthase
LDDTVLLALYASRQAVKKAGWNAKDNFGVNIGSSRGATGLFENYHREFIHSKSADVLTSPTTTLGNISSWVAHDLQTQGPEISHSITCSTALHALMNGIAWIQSGMCDKFLVGGSESPLTAFTIAQMRALHIYAQNNGTYPCRTLDLSKNKNTMILGEGAAMACIESGRTSHAMALIAGIGYATEILEHSASLSSNADCFQRSMRMALAGRDPGDIDIIITHSPGTIKGDQAEIKAIKRIFGDYHPALTTNKWKLGHTLGASGMLSIEMAVLMLKHQEFVQIPWMNQSSPSRIQNIMVNAVGFGGNAVSVLLKRSG